jgi:hypothetical protein
MRALRPDPASLPGDAQGIRNAWGGEKIRRFFDCKLQAVYPSNTDAAVRNDLTV